MPGCTSCRQVHDGCPAASQVVKCHEPNSCDPNLCHPNLWCPNSCDPNVCDPGLLHVGLPGRQRGQRLQRRGAQHDPAPPRRQHPATLRLRPKRWPICPARLSRGRRRGRRQRWREQGRADRGRRGRGGRRRAVAGRRAVCVEVVPSEGGAGAR